MSVAPVIAPTIVSDGELPPGLEPGTGEMNGVEVFHAGDFENKGTFTAGFLADLARNYDPTYHEAPITLDHANEGPAYGFIKKLWVDGPRLMADLWKVPRSMMDAIRGNRFPKRSIEFYTLDPVLKKPMLTALTFLGAGIPHAKSMPDVEFSFSFKDKAPRESVEQSLKRISMKEIVESPFKDHHDRITEETITGYRLGHFHEAFMDDAGNGFAGPAIHYDDDGRRIESESHTHRIDQGVMQGGGDLDHDHEMTRVITSSDDKEKATMANQDDKDKGGAPAEGKKAPTPEPVATPTPADSAEMADLRAKVKAQEAEGKKQAEENKELRADVAKMKADAFRATERERFNAVFDTVSTTNSEGVVMVQPSEKEGLLATFEGLPPDEGGKMTFGEGKEAKETTHRKHFLDGLIARSLAKPISFAQTVPPSDGRMGIVGHGGPEGDPEQAAKAKGVWCKKYRSDNPKATATDAIFAYNHRSDS